jgi:alkylhydroperoxidase family enzyme
MKEPMYLPTVADNRGRTGAYAELIDAAVRGGQVYSQIWHLFAFKPAATIHLERFTQEVMRGPSPLSAGLRELIAAYTSKLNDCEF